MRILKRFNRFFIICCAFIVGYLIFGLGYFSASSTNNNVVQVVEESLTLQLENDSTKQRNKNQNADIEVNNKQQSKNSLPEPKLIEKPKKKSPGSYDQRVNAKRFEATRLGYAVEPEFQIVPKRWQNILSERKFQVLDINSDIESEVKKQGKGSNSTTESVPVNATVTEPKPVTFNSKKILLYDSFKWWNFNTSTECPQNPEFKCQFVDRPESDHETFGAGATEGGGDFDAILMDRDFAHTDSVDLDSINSVRMEKALKNETLKRVYFALEAPFGANSFNIRVKPKNTYDSRDFLASYWRGSDIYTPYFAWRYYDSMVTTKPPVRNYAEGRTKMAAIVVSNCYAHNNRLELVEKLQQYINVDVYGGCGNNALCRSAECFKKTIGDNYKFYLAFENSNCRDYITEKLHSNAYMNDLLPIVLGAHPGDYKAVAPANSYIHVEDFDSVKELGEHLQMLDKNDDMYNAYFSWKETGEFYNRNFMCELCAFLHSEHLKVVKKFDTNIPAYSKYKDDITTYFNREDTYNFDKFYWSNKDELMCLPANKWYWNR